MAPTRAIAVAESRVDSGPRGRLRRLHIAAKLQERLPLRAIGHSLVTIAKGIAPSMSIARTAILSSMPDRPENLTRAEPEDLAAALAFALRFDVKRRNHDAAEIMARIIARRLVEHLAQSGFVVMKKPPVLDAAATGRGHGE